MDAIEDIEDALEIEIPQSDDLKVEDCRRLTGPGLLWDYPGALIQISTQDISHEVIIALWRKHARRVLDAIGWPGEKITERGFDTGINLAISAPMDQLYSAIFVAQTAWYFCATELLSVVPAGFDGMIDDLKAVKKREENPALIALLNAGQTHGIEVLCDDDEISLGHGSGSIVWPVSNIPDPDTVDWANLHNVPIALITGTNGKTTTTRLCAAIANASGKVSGLTSTDFVRVGNDVLDRGDYSGPGGARLLLRDPRLEMAFLEVARGGILRRGLPTRQACVACVTNVAADHLGQYGVNTVPELARAKFAVHRGLAIDGVLVLNADDDHVVAEAAQTKADICWFSLDLNTAQIVLARENGQACAWVHNGCIQFFDGQQTTSVIDVADIPITLSGAAQYNVMNALAATCVTRAMGIQVAAIRAGLAGFKNDPTDNPGRLNAFSIEGAQLFVDFAHNPHSIAAVAQTLSSIPAKRRLVLLSHAGDRADQDIRNVTEIALGLNPEIVVAAELPQYLRGRETGEITALVVQTCQAQGLREDQIIKAASPLEGVEKILGQLRGGDVVLLLVLSEREQIIDLLASRVPH